MMSYQTYRKRLQRLLFLLQHQQVRNAAHAAQQLGCCTRTVNNCLAKLRKDGFTIRYDRILQRYTIHEN